MNLTKKTIKNNLTAKISIIILSGTMCSHGYIVAGRHGADGSTYSESALSNTVSHFNHWDNVVRINGGTGVYLGASQNSQTGYVLTANHLGVLSPGSASITIAGASYAVNATRKIGTSDLRIYEVGVVGASGLLPNLPKITFASVNPSVGDQLLMLGRGSRLEGTDSNAVTSDMVNDSGFSVYHWGAAGAVNWALNDVGDVLPWLGSGATATWNDTSVGATQSAFFASFDDPGVGFYNSSYEGAGASGDSGGPSFIFRNNEWQLAGIASSVFSRGAQPARTSAFGNQISFANVAEYTTELPQLWDEGVSNIPEPSSLWMLSLAFLRALSMRRR